MQKNFRKILLGSALAAVLLITACGTGEPQEPTPDINAIRTEAVQTAMVEMTVQAALSPSKTAPSPTLTPLPTATLSTDAAQPAAGSSSSSSSGGSSSGGSSGTAIPTPTPDAWKCQIVNEYPSDVPQMTGWAYDRHWVIKNIGTTTWWANDVFVEFDTTCTLCENIAYQTKFYINKNVVPGDTINIFVDISVPTRPIAFPGYTMAWNMESGVGGLICEFWNNIPSTYPPAPTATP